MTDETDLFKKVLESETVKEAYGDLVSPAAKEVGGAARDVAHGLRLFTAPFLLAGHFFDCLQTYLEEARRRVPEERQTEAVSEVAGPAMLGLRFVENHQLQEMYVNLLAATIDKQKQNQAHPAFPMILGQMAPIEASLINLIFKNDPIRRKFDIPFEQTIGDRYHARALKKVIDNYAKPTDEYPENLWPYVNHLESLKLIGQKISKSTTKIEGENPESASYEVFLGTTEFGDMFCETCIPAPVTP